jgi:hypothetical protein
VPRYGWSTGTPLLSTLTADAEVVAAEIGPLLESHDLGGLPVVLLGRCAELSPAKTAVCRGLHLTWRKIIFGRSIGSTCAVHLASLYGDSGEDYLLLAISKGELLKEALMLRAFSRVDY